MYFYYLLLAWHLYKTYILCFVCQMIFHEFHWISPCLFWQTSPRMQKPRRAIGTRWGWGDRPSLRGAQFDGRRNPPEALTGKMLRKTLVGCHICICWFYNMTCLIIIIGICLFIMKWYEMYIIIYIYICSEYSHYFRCWNLNGIIYRVMIVHI